MFKRILLPVDGSDTCNSVFQFAQEFHEKFDATLILVHVDDSSIVQNYVNFPTTSMNIQVDGQKRSEEILKMSCEKLDVPDSHLVIKHLAGEAASAILDVAEEENADLILICTHGMGAARRFLIGSVTNRVVHHSKIPVMIIRQDEK